MASQGLSAQALALLGGQMPVEWQSESEELSI